MAKPKAATFPRLIIRKQLSEAKLQDYGNEPSPLLPANHATDSSGQTMLGVVAFLDIRTDDGDDVSRDFELALIAMGAKVRKTFTDNVTHLIFKNGSTATLQRAYSKSIHVVNLLWITRSQTLGCKLDEKQFAIDRPSNLSVGLRKRRKSMEPGRVKELVLDPRRFSSSWITDSDNPNMQQDNSKALARLSLDDNEKKPRRHTLGGIRQSVLKFAREWKRNEIKHIDNNIVSKKDDILARGQQTHDTPMSKSQSNNAYGKTSLSAAKAKPDDQRINQDLRPNKPMTRIIPLPRPTIFSELQLSTSGLPYTIASARSPRLTMTRPPPPRSTNHKTTIAVSPSVNPDVKSSFYFATNTSQERLTKSSQGGQSPSLKRKRRSSIGPRLSLQGDERAALLNLSNDQYMQSHKHQKHDHKIVVLTSMDQQSRDMCCTVIKNFGSYKLGDTINDSTTHVIVGCKRRTMSVAFGILRGLWLVTVDWIKASAEAGYYVPEKDYEIIDWYPKCSHTRILAAAGTLPGVTLLKSRRIYIGKTMFDRQLVLKLTSECGATICESHDSAALVLACEPNPNIPTVIENWLFDCIEQFEDLPIEPYLLDIGKSLPPY